MIILSLTNARVWFVYSCRLSMGNVQLAIQSVSQEAFQLLVNEVSAETTHTTQSYSMTLS